MMQELYSVFALFTASIWLRMGLGLLLAVLGGRWLGRSLRRYGAQFTSRTDTIADDYLVRLAGYTVEWGGYAAGVLVILSALGVDITPFLTGAGFAGIVIGLAAREYLANVIGGMIIIADRPFTIGERILLPKSLGDLYGTWGDVIAIGLRSTKVLSTDGVILTIPNSMLMNDVVVNFSHTLSPNLRVRLHIGVHPRPENVQGAIALLRQIVENHPDIKRHPRPPQTIIRELKPYEALLEVRFYVEEPWQVRLVRSDLFERFIEQAPARGLRLSAPAQRLYLHGQYEPPGGAGASPTAPTTEEDDGPHR